MAMDADMMRTLATAMGTGALKSQYGKAEHRYDTNYYDPYTAAGGDALSMYKNALGLGGAEGTKAAQGAFQTSPGYDFAMKQGTQALDRSAAGRGMYGSGNNAAALTQYGQGLANQDYGNWLSRLKGLGDTGFGAAQGQTGRQGALSNIDMGLGNQIANLLMQSMPNQQQQQQPSNDIFSALLGGANLASKFFLPI